MGRVLGHRDGHGFVQREDGQPDVYLPLNEMRAVLHADKVRVRIQRLDRRGRPEGKVLEILERPDQPIIGRLLQESGVFLVAPEDRRFGQDILIPKGMLGGAELGQVVVARLTEAPSLFAQPVGRVVEVLGGLDDPGMEIEIAVRKYGVPHRFSDDCLNLAKALPEELRPSDYKDRVDLRDVPLVTIDGEDARDFDDAVLAVPTQFKRKKAWRLLVAIADVSHYVETGSAIDVDAYDRATSVYFPRRVIPMLPEKLSNGLCSLKPAVDRLCMVCDMVIDLEGEIQAYQFYPAVMHSHARLTYTEVATILANTNGPQAQKYADVLEPLLNLHGLYRCLVKARQRRGAVDFETTETKIISDDNGRIQRIVPSVRNDAHKLIEEAMLAANVCSAEFIQTHKHLALYRVHEGPTPEKREALRQFLRALGIAMPLSEEPLPSEFQAIAEATRDRPDAQQIHTMLLRSMQQAIYSPHNSGHFGLAYAAYTHFTSPIRRYPDLLVHRVIKGILKGKAYVLPELPTPTEPLSKRRMPAAPKADAQSGLSKTDLKRVVGWEAAGLHCSINERRADEASKDVESWLKCQYMREHLGEEFDGTVTAIASMGLFVTLDSLYVEGLVHITELGDEYFRLDEVRQELRGDRTGIRYAMGTPVRVQVSRVDLDARKIDFRLVNGESKGRKVASPRSGQSMSQGGGADAVAPLHQETRGRAGAKPWAKSKRRSASSGATEKSPRRDARSAGKANASGKKPAGKKSKHRR